MAFTRLAGLTAELSRRWGHLPPAVPRSQAVPADVVNAAIRRVQTGQAEPIDAELVVRSLASVVKAGPSAEGAVERHLQRTPVESELWLQGLTDPGLPSTKRAAWTAFALKMAALSPSELSLVQWFSLPVDKRGLPQTFMLHVPPAKWGEWLDERAVTSRLEVPLVQELILHSEPFQPQHFAPAMLQHWRDARLLRSLLARSNIEQTRKLGGRLLALGHALLHGQAAVEFRNIVRQTWRDLDPVHKGSARGLSAEFLGLTDAQAKWLNSQESDAEFMAFMEAARTEASWAGERAVFWQESYPLIRQLGYSVERSASNDRLIMVLDNGGFAVEFLDAGPLSFYSDPRYVKLSVEAASSAMKSARFRNDFPYDWKVNHLGHWYDKAIDELERFAQGRR